MSELPEGEKVKRVAITGSIGSGKSTVSKMIAEHYPVFYCDELNAKLLQDSELVKNEIIAAFGEHLYSGGQIDKRLLAEIVFQDPEKREELEQIMHPKILDEIHKQFELLLTPLVFVEVPLLFEVSWHKYFDYSVLVFSEDEEMIRRLVARGMEKEDAQRRLSLQMRMEEKIKLADYIIKNDGTLEDLHQKVIELVKVLEGN